MEEASCRRRPAASSTTPSESTSVSGIMRKAMNFLPENKQLTTRVFVLVFIPFLILAMLHSVIAIPSIAKVEDGYENSSLDHQDLISLVVIEIHFTFIFCLVLIFASAITISATVSTHQGKSPGLNEILLRIKSSWKFFLISGLCFWILSAASFGATVILTQLTAPMGGVLAAVLAYPYLASVCTLVLVISTVEDECERKMAFRRAGEIVRQDRFKGYFLMLMLMLLSFPVYVLVYVASTDDDDENGLIMRFGFLLVATFLFCLTVFFNSLVYTMFYLDLKQRSAEELEYLLVPISD